MRNVFEILAPKQALPHTLNSNSHWRGAGHFFNHFKNTSFIPSPSLRHVLAILCLPQFIERMTQGAV